jgi:peptide deformylase
MHDEALNNALLGDVLQIGDPRLREVSAPIIDFLSPTLARETKVLHEALANFRVQHGFGRAIAAPQFGIPKRFIALHLPHWQSAPFTAYNPVITWSSPETFTLWDDCMSFPFLLVKVKRHASINIRYQNECSELVEIENLAPADAELIQHEVDHLDGILAVDRAVDMQSLISRSTFESMRDYFQSQVD